jgi:hypothetical protein
LSPTVSDPLSRALAAQAAGRSDEAAALFEQVLAGDGRSVPALVSLGQIRQNQGALDAAKDLYLRALKIERGLAGLHNNLGAVVVAQGDDAAAIPAFTAALALEPANLPFRYNLAGALDRAGRAADALTQYDAMLARAPGHILAILGRASALFALGRWDEAWTAYGERHRLHWGTYPAGRRPLPSPHWQGEPIASKKLLLAYEQGLGEQIMFASHIPELRALGARLVLECEPRLVPLFARSFPDVEVVAWQQPWSPAVKAADMDFHVTAGDAARWLRRGQPGVAASTGYLKGDPQRTAAIRARYEALAGGRRIVGLSWHSAGVNYGKQKSMALAALAPLLGRPDIFYVSLQYGVTPTPTQGLFFDPDLDVTGDLEAAAAQCAAMDLVVTVSNTTAHLAAALGKPVWLMLPKAAGKLWYWFSDLGTHPWYTTLRPVVQTQSAVWDDVVAKVAAAL